MALLDAALESGSIRPGSSAIVRALRVPETVKRSSSHEQKAIFGPLAILTGEDYSNLTPEQVKLLGLLLERAMYFNLVRDSLIKKTKGKPENLLFAQEYIGLSKFIDEITEKAKQAGFSDEVVNSIPNWFTADLAISVSLYTMAKGNQYFLSWEPVGDSQAEVEIYTEIRKLFQELNPKSRTQAAIALRTISSLYFAKLILSMGKNKEISTPDRGSLTRLTAMLVAVQMVDDAASIVKDQEEYILGMGKSTLRNSELTPRGSLEISSEDAKRIIHLSREVLGACIDIMEIDPKNSLKQLIAYAGLLSLAVLSGVVITKTHGGTKYPVVDSVRYLLQELIIKAQRDSPTREFTTRAIRTAVRAGLNR